MDKVELEPVTSSGVYKSKPITSIEQFIYDIELVTSKWTFDDDISGCPWFRGSTNGLDHKPQPTVLRRRLFDISGSYDEFQLTRMFRNRAAVMGETPPRDDIDQWLFLMRHFGLPTRLLDWTEGALIALYFAVYGSNMKEDPAVWMIHPLELNKKTAFIEYIVTDESPLYYSIRQDIPEGKYDFSTNELLGMVEEQYSQQREIMRSVVEAGLGELKLKRINTFPNTWVKGNIGNEYCRLAFHPKVEWATQVKGAGYYPIAIQAYYNNSRMSAQKSCFTIHGQCEDDFESLFAHSTLVEENYFKKYVIDKYSAFSIRNKLESLGITYSTVYPDLQGLATEVGARFFRLKV